MTEINFLKYYNLEEYIFKEVSEKFHKDHKLNAFDFFCIIIWKANRAKSKIAKRLLELYNSDDLEECCRRFTSEIYDKKTKEERLRLVLEKGFYLPMASAILTVFYPQEFTVYDVRICDVLKEYEKLKNKKTERIVNEYFEFVKTVKKQHPNLSLRDNDRFLWGQSFSEDLKRDIGCGFKKTEEKQK